MSLAVPPTADIVWGKPDITDQHGSAIGFSLAHSGYPKGESVAGASSALPQAEEKEQGEEIKLWAFSQTKDFANMEAINRALATHTAVASSADPYSYPRGEPSLDQDLHTASQCTTSSTSQRQQPPEQHEQYGDPGERPESESEATGTATSLVTFAHKSTPPTLSALSKQPSTPAILPPFTSAGR